ncbi:metallophosphoesterase [Paraburkholderia antibiotica]|uniref:Serine/threonine protein phosphatase n=1 Tax=Paraburkholderia antibiotica TaxID=2728839 RepID=A0A7Y0FGC3_9BURK|nr:metallophosphoesterase [Paraburkholderia antibiotica]NML34923.1 serine/threonine protein phosphatase [Paraburkholderia antibiotica]
MTFVKHFERNTSGRDFAVGDIHGCFKLLRTDLDNMGFDPSRDRLFSVGDLVDRGPDSELALEWIDEPWFHAVRGNHEDMAIRYPSGNMDAANYAANGGAWNVGNPRHLQLAFSCAFDALPVAIEVETEGGLIGILHADCPFPTWRDFTVSLDDANMSNKMRKAVFEAALWSRERIQDEDVSGVPDLRALIVGHTPLKSPAVLGNVHYIDTGAVFRGGYFTFINLATLETVPAMQKKLEWEAA